MRRYGVVIAARTGSRRLPGKALLPLKGLPMIVFLIRRLRSSKLMDGMFFATTTLPQDDALAEIVSHEGIPIFRGERDDVVARFVGAARRFDLEYVVRVTGDCPFVDGETLDRCLNACNQSGDFDIATTKGRFPVGIDYEIYKVRTMELLHQQELSPEEREHLTLPIYNRPNLFQIMPLHPPADWPAVSAAFTVDTKQDYEFACRIAELHQGIDFSVPALLQTAISLKIYPEKDGS